MAVKIEIKDEFNKKSSARCDGEILRLYNAAFQVL